jgi:hypothetical protein
VARARGFCLFRSLSGRPGPGSVHWAEVAALIHSEIYLFIYLFIYYEFTNLDVLQNYASTVI